jgi:hypothetical protein
VISRLASIIEKHWRIILLATSMAMFGLAIGRSLLDVRGFSVTLVRQPPLNIDAALFEHGGWYISQGAVPYVDIWDIKPPLALETTALLALAASGNAYALHLLCVMVMAAAGMGTVMLVGSLAERLTGSHWAGLVSGLAMLSLPGFYYLAGLGFRPRYLMLLFGLLSVELMLHERPFWAGVCSAAASGYFLMGAVFPLIVLLIWIQRRQGGWPWAVLAGMLAAIVSALLPILAWGAMTPMLVEALLVPMLTTENLSFSTLLARILEQIRYVALLVPFGFYGLLRYGLRRPWHSSWTALGGGWFMMQVFFLDFDSFPDFFGALTFVALGCGLVVANSDSWLRRGLISLTLVLVLLSGLGRGSLGILFPPFVPPGQNAQAEVEGREGLPNMAYYYWNQIRPESCHYRLSAVERVWLERTDQPLFETECERHSWGEIISILQSAQ